jgi:GTP:adenosylcobinamide-phosphate guanylyltransferase
VSSFAAIVLAGDRRRDDPLVLAKSSRCKALVDVGGAPMLQRVLDALAASNCIQTLYLSGPSRETIDAHSVLRGLIDVRDVRWRPPGVSPSASAHALLGEIPPAQPVLLTTADLPLLQARFIEHFCAHALASGADVVVGLAPYGLVRESFPAMKKTVLRFSDGEYCGCNLFAFLSPAGRKMADRWREVENQRKSPLKVVRMLGWGAVLRYRLGWLSLDTAMAAVRMPFADAAVDVDSLDDHRLVEQRLRDLARTPRPATPV